jgi:hypothetical protein
MYKITKQEMKGNNKGSMGQKFVEYIHVLPKGYVIPSDYVRVENCSIMRDMSGTIYNVLAVIARENDRVVSLEMIVEKK